MDESPAKSAAAEDPATSAERQFAALLLTGHVSWVTLMRSQHDGVTIQQRKVVPIYMLSTQKQLSFELVEARSSLEGLGRAFWDDGRVQSVDRLS